MEPSNIKNIELIEEEIEALEAIFCGEGEFIIHSNVEGGIFVQSETLNITIDLKIKCLACSTVKNQDICTIQMTVCITREYPDTLPNVSLLSTHFKKKEIIQFRDNLLSYAKTLPHEPIILDMALWLQENAPHTSSESTTSENENKKKGVKNELVILRLDHMRNRTCYLKTLSGWTKDLDIRMIVFFAHKVILIIFEGQSENVKEFLRRFRSCNIDVDCSGKPCKEKMMTIVAQIQRSTSLT
jgi:hypothetical protein